MRPSCLSISSDRPGICEHRLCGRERLSSSVSRLTSTNTCYKPNRHELLLRLIALFSPTRPICPLRISTTSPPCTPQFPPSNRRDAHSYPDEEPDNMGRVGNRPHEARHADKKPRDHDDGVRGIY